MQGLGLQGVRGSRPFAGGAPRGLAIPASLGIHAILVTAVVMAGVFHAVPPEPRTAVVSPPLWPLPTAPTVRQQPPGQGRPDHRRGGASAGIPLPVPPPPIDGSPANGVTDPQPDSGLTEGSGLEGSAIGPDAGEGRGGPAEGTGGEPGTGGPIVVRRGGNIEPPAKLHHVAPVYPEIARAARVQGTVVLECTIDVTGRVVGARVVQSVPLLDRAAMEAVGRWIYAPTRLNGQPVAVVMNVTVRFTLGR